METNSRGEHPEPFEEDAEMSRKIFSRFPAQFYKIDVLKKDLLQKDLLVFQSDRGALISSRLPYYLADRNVAGIQYASRSDEEKILFWSPHEIGVVNFTKQEGSLFEKGPTRTILYKEGRDIRQAFWAYDDSHILFLDAGEVQLIEAAGPPPPLLRPVEAVKPGTFFVYAERGHLFYYLDPESGRLRKRKLVE